MLPPTLHLLHAHRAILVIVVAGLAAVAVAVWIAVANFHEGRPRPGVRRPGWPPGRRPPRP